MSTPAIAMAELCPRCHAASLFMIREQVPSMKQVEQDGRIVREETHKLVEVRVCSDEACGYRSDDA